MLSFNPQTKHLWVRKNHFGCRDLPDRSQCCELWHFCRTGRAPSGLNGHINGSSGIKQTPISRAAVNRCAAHQRHAFVRLDNIHGGGCGRVGCEGSRYVPVKQSIKASGNLRVHKYRGDTRGNTHSLFCSTLKNGFWIGFNRRKCFWDERVLLGALLARCVSGYERQGQLRTGLQQRWVTQYLYSTFYYDWYIW